MSSDENTDLFLCCTWKIIINQSKAELSNGKAAKRNPYGLHFFTFFLPQMNPLALTILLCAPNCVHLPLYYS